MCKHIIFLFSFSIMLWQACVPVVKNLPSDSTTTAPANSQFPESWLGTWAGTLIISKPNGDTIQVPMQLHYATNDTLDKGWDWHIIYGKDIEKGRRAYTLHEKNADMGHYVIDEHNGIILDCYLLGNTLYSRFAVADNLLTTMTRKTADLIIFEIISGKQTPVNSTGNIDDIPEVSSYNINVQQKAVLSRIK